MQKIQTIKISSYLNRILNYKLISIQDYDIHVSFIVQCLLWTLLVHYCFKYKVNDSTSNINANANAGLNSKNINNNYAVITNPDKYVNIAMEKNMAFLEVKLDCIIFTNKTIYYYNYNTTVFDEILENIHLLDIKLRLDENVLKRFDGYNKINMPRHDLKSYKNLETAMQRNLDKIDEYTNYLNKTCKNFLVYLDKINISSARDVKINNTNYTIYKAKNIISSNTTINNSTTASNTTINNSSITSSINTTASNTTQQNINCQQKQNQILNLLNKIMIDIETIKKDKKQSNEYTDGIPEYNIDNYLESDFNYDIEEF